MGWWSRLFGKTEMAVAGASLDQPPAQPKAARRKRSAEDVCGAQHVGAWVDNHREEPLLELPMMLLALTNGELGNVTVQRIETLPPRSEWDGGGPIARPNDGSHLELRSEKGCWKIPPLDAPRPYIRVLQDDLDMMTIAGHLNAALAQVGAAGRLYNLEAGHFAYATVDQLEALIETGELAEQCELPAERVRSFPLKPGTMARLWPNGTLHTGILAKQHVIDGVPCAPGEIHLQDGVLISATLASGHSYGEIELPAGTELSLWSRGHPNEALMKQSITIAGVTLPAGSTIHFYEEGRLSGVELGAELYVLGARAEEGDWLHFEGGRWVEWEQSPLWRPTIDEDVDFDEEFRSVAELNRLYPAPEGFSYEPADGKYLLRRHADGAAFSISVYGGILGFWESRIDPKRGHVANNSEILRVEPLEDASDG